MFWPRDTRLSEQYVRLLLKWKSEISEQLKQRWKTSSIQEKYANPRSVNRWINFQSFDFLLNHNQGKKSFQTFHLYFYQFIFANYKVCTMCINLEAWRHAEINDGWMKTTLNKFGADVCHTNLAVFVKLQSMGGRAQCVCQIRVQVPFRNYLI